MKPFISFSNKKFYDFKKDYINNMISSLEFKCHYGRGTKLLSGKSSNGWWGLSTTSPSSDNFAILATKTGGLWLNELETAGFAKMIIKPLSVSINDHLDEVALSFLSPMHFFLAPRLPLFAASEHATAHSLDLQRGRSR
jgi:hypothetical protein